VTASLDSRLRDPRDTLVRATAFRHFGISTFRHLGISAQRTPGTGDGGTMATAIPQAFHDLFQKKAFGHLATLMPDGSPQVNPVWVDYDGTHVVFNTAKGRWKDRNLRRDARVAMEIQDPDNAYRYLQVRGRIADVTETGADEHIDKLAKKYMGVEKYPLRQPGEVRVIYKIEPERVSTMG
jgi:PPOX class probable F420-dependent enzyme